MESWKPEVMFDRQNVGSLAEKIKVVAALKETKLGTESDVAPLNPLVISQILLSWVKGGRLNDMSTIHPFYAQKEDTNLRVAEFVRYMNDLRFKASWGLSALEGIVKGNEDEMKDFRQVNGILQGHPDMKHIPGVDMTTGSLGQGLSASVGMALAGKLDNKDYRVYCVLGDGEIEEGQVWEAAMSAAHYKLDNLVAIVDNNNLQIDGEIGKVMSPYPIDEKFKSFGFNVITINGNEFDEIEKAFTEAKNCKEKPTAIIAKTIKGKGVPFMENKAEWHGKAPTEEQYMQALKDLEV